MYLSIKYTYIYTQTLTQNTHTTCEEKKTTIVCSTENFPFSQPTSERRKKTGGKDVNDVTGADGLFVCFTILFSYST